ncbi:hypothetical protein HELRODRAFT_106279 [Helobdella robusta]|uniref:Inward rectifier potassium channel C-terminal domain-containing protein n=1 Tax=Helobdella robusta TaxID=6412 RepID=T1EE13_HELRO|nr:hypothetical protein HELRODRAFT_106279 [Helobdella robusta]ESO06688.1 hypothetical protein HELRODRAFT_106279 [Helobdella robusta]
MGKRNLVAPTSPRPLPAGQDNDSNSTTTNNYSFYNRPHNNNNKHTKHDANHIITTLTPSNIFVDYKDQQELEKHQKKSQLQNLPPHHHHHGYHGENLGALQEFTDDIDRQRLVFKNGECNVNRANIKKRRQRYMADIFTTLVDIKWRWNLLNFVLAFMLSWFIFALLWWLIAFSHGDLDAKSNDKKLCVQEVRDFLTALLFSIETQQTIGYGSRHTNPHCAEAILVMMFQSCFGVIIQALMTGLVFAKLSRPKKRAETLLFSKNALICKRDEQMCLVFRVGDMRKSHIVEAHVRAIMIKKRVTQEGEVIPLYQRDLKLGDGETEGRLFMVWPVIVEHHITEDSPFWSWSAEDLKREKFELVVVLEGIVESTGMTTQARTSYLPEEIIWGHRFEKLVTFQKETNQYLIDYSRFHLTVCIDIPKYSAQQLETMRQQHIHTSSSNSTSSSSSLRSSSFCDDVLIDTYEDEDAFDHDAHSTTSDPIIHRSDSRKYNSKKRSESGCDTLGPMRSLLHSNGIAGAALLAFDLQNDDLNSTSIGGGSQ